ncbi:hypothetical protein A7U60_g4537 [Sanghuangporus baumii]|uniref:Uncharacterized protein n=1 Tax=Sanghuangporus baumii TaxID=108892 RepID=A0A9Q5N535_SANBA|nr:hypothetical protein A7U60_g4537 [Sanghuangporus baumii]
MSTFSSSRLALAGSPPPSTDPVMSTFSSSRLALAGSPPPSTDPVMSTFSSSRLALAGSPPPLFGPPMASTVAASGLLVRDRRSLSSDAAQEPELELLP